MEVKNPKLDESLAELKKNIGKVVIQMNDDMLTVQQAYKKRKSTKKELGEKEKIVENRIVESRAVLESAALKLSENPEYVKYKGVDKLSKLINTTIETAKILIETTEGHEKVSEEELKKIKENAQKSLEEAIEEERKTVRTFDDLSKTLSTLTMDKETSDTVESELAGISQYKQERYRKVEKTLKKYMKEQIKQEIAAQLLSISPKYEA